MTLNLFRKREKQPQGSKIRGTIGSDSEAQVAPKLDPIVDDEAPSSERAYDDFDIEIGPRNGSTYPVAVLRSPAGEARGTMYFPFDDHELDEALNHLEKVLLRSGGQRRAALTPDEEAVQEFGGHLFDALFESGIRHVYDVSLERTRRDDRGLRIKLRINDPRLAALPWEYMFDSRSSRFIALSSRTPLVRYIELPQPQRPFIAPAPLRILGMIASPEGLDELDIDREKKRIEVALQELTEQDIVELVWLEGSTWRDLQRAMYEGPWHVFHFIGHGAFDAGRDEGYIALTDDDNQSQLLSATELARLVTDHHSLRLVLLNSCDGGRGSQRSIFSSMASILIQQGVPAVMAMQYEITDQGAIECARSFYQALTYGLPVDAALAEARKGISLHINNSLEWGVPVLYMRTVDGALFHAERTERSKNLAGKSPQPKKESPKKATRPRPSLATQSRVRSALQGRGISAGLWLFSATGWAAGGVAFWYTWAKLMASPEWSAGLAWLVMSLLHFLMGRRFLSSAGQWILSSASGWSLGWLIGWSINWNVNLGSADSAVWAISGAAICGVGATLLSALQEENLEARIVFSAVGVVGGSLAGYGIWLLLGPTAWTQVVLIAILYLLIGLTIALLHVLVSGHHTGWLTKLGTILLVGALVGGASWFAVTLIGYLRGIPVGITANSRATQMVLAGNLAGAFAGVQIAAAISQGLQAKRRLFIAGATIWSILGGIIPAVFPMLLMTLSLPKANIDWAVATWLSDSWVAKFGVADIATNPVMLSTVLVVLPLPIWVLIVEKRALIHQLADDRQWNVLQALVLLRARRWLGAKARSSIRLSDAKLAGMNLSHSNLSGVDFTNADLSDVDLSHAQLVGAQLSDANLQNADLSAADLRRADLKGANLVGALLHEADVTHASYDDETQWPSGFDYLESGALGPQAKLQGSILSGIRLNGVNLMGADLSYADLSRAVLNGTRLVDVTLERADLKGADLSQARLIDVNLAEARYDERTKWPSEFDPIKAGAVLVKTVAES